VLGRIVAFLVFGHFPFVTTNRAGYPGRSQSLETDRDMGILPGRYAYTMLLISWMVWDVFPLWIVLSASNMKLWKATSYSFELGWQFEWPRISCQWLQPSCLCSLSLDGMSATWLDLEFFHLHVSQWALWARVPLKSESTGILGPNSYAGLVNRDCQN
jgi:hypothetical protein